MARILIAALICIFVACTSAFAGGAGNCVQPLKTTTKHIGVGAAGEYNYVHERMNDLENKRGPRSMKVEKVNQIYGKGIIGLGDNVNFYGKAGVANYDLKFVDNPQDADMEIDLKNGIYTGGGLNAHFPITKIQSVALGVGFDLQSNFSYNEVDGITRSGQAATLVDGSYYSVDGTNSLYLTCRYDINSLKTSIVPYVGGYSSWMVIGTAEGLSYQTTSTGFVEKEDFQAAFDFQSFGVLIGVDVDVLEYFNLNVEGRFIGETAIATGAT